MKTDRGATGKICSSAARNIALQDGFLINHVRVPVSVRLGPKITETVNGKLRLKAKIVKAGWALEVFTHAFSANAGEKLLKASQCYRSTTTGSMAGLLIISTNKIAFCSEEIPKIGKEILSGSIHPEPSIK
ncbi:GEM-like protein 7 [Malus sylvestris]|uniref:GEM-like protein 7 n=1 Tax=Malus sylvestris TaxID=3752 RepID=UPI0021AC6FD7|nr:GEM-like protein 7 [Malus sylvestris]